MSDHDHASQVAAYGLCRVCDGRPPAEAEQARDDSIYEALIGAPEAWLLEARRIVRAVTAAMPDWTTDDIWARLAQPAEPRALGAVLRDLAEQGEIVKTGRMRNSTRPECHARPLACWRSAVDRPVGVVDEPLF